MSPLLEWTFIYFTFTLFIYFLFMIFEEADCLTPLCMQFYLTSGVGNH